MQKAIYFTIGYQSIDYLQVVEASRNEWSQIMQSSSSTKSWQMYFVNVDIYSCTKERQSRFYFDHL
jgi:hypothetical protein